MISKHGFIKLNNLGAWFHKTEYCITVSYMNTTVTFLSMHILVEYAVPPEALYMKGHGLFRFPWIAQRYYKQA